jgi:thiol-disulfide isomerase/thioredoxin
METYISPKLEAVFAKILVDGMTEGQLKHDNQEGATWCEYRQVMEPEFAKLQKKGIPPYQSDFAFMNLIFQDKIFFTKDFTQFSLIPLEGYFSWSSVLAKDFPGCVLDIKQGKLHNTVSPRLNYDMLQRIFRLDLAHAAESDEVHMFEKLVNENGSLMLDESREVPQVYFASVMRSGNTLSRKLMESISGVSTGSNYNIIPSINMALTIQGFKAENHYDSKVWILKTHFPYILPYANIMTAGRAVLLVRNPLDIIVSQFMMSTTVTHSRTCANDFTVEFADEWKWLVK